MILCKNHRPLLTRSRKPNSSPLKSEFFGIISRVLYLLCVLPISSLQSCEPNPGKQMQPDSEHWPFPLHRSGHLRMDAASRCSSHLLRSSTSFRSHSFSSSGKVAFSHDGSSFSCRSATHMATARLIVEPANRSRQPTATLEFPTVRSH